MATTSLANYDGSAGTLVDTKIWVDCIDDASQWHEWALDQLQACSERAPLHVNLIIYTELLVPGASAEALDAMLGVYGARRSDIPWACASLTAAAFSLSRRRGGGKQKPIADFYIGAHAAVANLSVLTRDPKPYRRYFPRLIVAAP